MNEYERTDMASECCSDPELRRGIRGIRFQEEVTDGFPISRLCIESEEGEAILGKPRGSYITLTVGKLWLSTDEEAERATERLAAEIRGMIAALCPEPHSVLIVGLGNRLLISDAIGPLCVEQVTVSRHIATMDPSLFEQLATLPVAAVAPGVIGQTGIETVELIRGAVETVKPSLVICVDALAARDVERLAVTVQLSDSGIAPGSGIGNHRIAISRETLGVPVLAIGVPTVVDSSTLVYGMLEKAGVTELSEQLREALNNGRSFFVTLKDTDVSSAEAAKLIARALDTALSR